jgi:CDP-diacylglycerol--serine O-phosphatidyltransferase
LQANFFNELKKHIPNLLTLGNLLFGCLAVIKALEGAYELVALFIFISALLDFLDGFVARLLKVQGELGVQLDSLADMVSFGFTPAAVGISMLRDLNDISSMENSYTWLIYAPLLLTIASCYRLAKFNIDTRQSDGFIGMPTPANALFWVFLPFLFRAEPLQHFVFAQTVQLRVLIYLLVVVFSYFMISELRFFALKFSKAKKQQNVLKISLILICGVIVSFFGLKSVSILILLYGIFSIINTYLTKQKN